MLVSGTDGVGTKLKLAFALGPPRHRGHRPGGDVGERRARPSGAEPLFFLDYFATSRLDVDQAEQVIAGIAKGCELAGCTLLGGETAELPGFYAAGEYELAGFCVGVVEKSEDHRRPPHRSRAIALIGLASAGCTRNGYSLARKILADRG